jgi:hypothetical protein
MSLAMGTDTKRAGEDPLPLPEPGVSLGVRRFRPWTVAESGHELLAVLSLIINNRTRIYAMRQGSAPAMSAFFKGFGMSLRAARTLRNRQIEQLSRIFATGQVIDTTCFAIAGFTKGGAGWRQGHFPPWGETASPGVTDTWFRQSLRAFWTVRLVITPQEVDEVAAEGWHRPTNGFTLFAETRSVTMGNGMAWPAHFRLSLRWSH